MLGLFDSGYGGLSILRAVQQELPTTDIIYLADQAHAPYGLRAATDVRDLTRHAVEMLFNQGCRLVVLACNTASAISLRWLQQEWLPQQRQWQGQNVRRNVLGIVVPTLEAITGQNWHITTPSPLPAAQIGLFATPSTIHSRVYEIELAHRAPQMQLYPVALPHLAGSIEAGASAAALAAQIKQGCAQLLQQCATPDAVILGCTHYALIEHIFRSQLPHSIKIINQPQAVAQSLRQYLLKHPHYVTQGRGQLSLLSTAPQAHTTLTQNWPDFIEIREMEQ